MSMYSPTSASRGLCVPILIAGAVASALASRVLDQAAIIRDAQGHLYWASDGGFSRDSNVLALLVATTVAVHSTVGRRRVTRTPHVIPALLVAVIWVCALVNSS